MTSPFSTTAGYIRKRLQDNIGAIPVLHENMAKSQIYNANSMPAEFVMLEINGFSGNQATLGSEPTRKHRYSGIIVIHVFTKVGYGTGRSLEICDLVANIFRSTQFEGVTTFASSVDSGSMAGDAKGQYWRNTVNTSFFIDFNQ